MADDDKPVFCVDCVHYRHIELPMAGPVFFECRHPRAKRDLVHGTWPVCHDERSSALGCGSSGTRFQRKPAAAPQPPPNRRLGRRRLPVWAEVGLFAVALWLLFWIVRP